MNDAAAATEERFISAVLKDGEGTRWKDCRHVPAAAFTDYAHRRSWERIQSSQTYEEAALVGAKYFAHSTLGIEYRSDRWAILCEYVKREGASALPALTQVGASSKFPDLETEPSEDEILAPSPIIIDGLLEAGDKMVIGGGSKSYKTWTFIDLALSVAHGAQWWGRQCVRGPVVYVNFEIKGKNFWKRVFTVRRARGFPQAGPFYVWNLRGGGFTLDDNFQDLIRFALKVGATVIVLDPIYKLYGKRNENALGDMATLFDLIDKVGAATGASIIFGAHFAKGSTTGKDPMERISGSGGFQRDPDCIMTLTRLDQGEGTNAFSVSTVLRDLPPIEDFGVTWDFPLMTCTEGLNLKNLHNPAKPGKKYSVADMVRVLSGKQLTTTEWQQGCKEALGMGRGTFFDYLPEVKGHAVKAGGVWRAA